MIFGTSDISTRMLKCRVAKELDHDSDHLPVETILNLKAPAAAPEPRKMWKKVNKAKLQATITPGLQSLEEQYRGGLTSKCRVAGYAEGLATTISEGIDAAVLWSKQSRYSKSGFTSECKEAISEANRLRRRWQSTRDPEDRTAYNIARNYKGHLISKSLTKIHRDRVSEAVNTLNGLWKLAKWSKNGGAQGPSYMPQLEGADGRKATSSEGKARILAETFFPKPQQADLEGYLTSRSCQIGRRQRAGKARVIND